MGGEVGAGTDGGDGGLRLFLGSIKAGGLPNLWPHRDLRGIIDLTSTEDIEKVLAKGVPIDPLHGIEAIDAAHRNPELRHKLLRGLEIFVTHLSGRVHDVASHIEKRGDRVTSLSQGQITRLADEPTHYDLVKIVLNFLVVIDTKAAAFPDAIRRPLADHAETFLGDLQGDALL